MPAATATSNYETMRRRPQHVVSRRRSFFKLATEVDEIECLQAWAL
jgi:hypothetical protein